MSKYFLGGDVSKGYADWVLLDATDAVVLKPFRLDDTPAGHKALLQQLHEVRAQDAQAEFYIGVEYTGGLEQNWAHGLRRAKNVPIQFACLNPKGVAQYVKGNLTRTITDSVSAEMIARYLQVHHSKVNFNAVPHPMEPLRPQWSALVLLKKQRHQLTNTLQSLLYTAMPSILVYCRHGFPQWVLSVVEAFPTAAQLSRARQSTLSRIPFVSAARAAKLIEAARTNVASRTDKSVGALIKMLIGQVHHLDRVIEHTECSLCAQVTNEPQVELLCSFKGIGQLSAIGLLMNLPDLQKTPDAAHLSSYWGLHPVNKNSGDGQTQPRMSKAGRVQARAVLFMVAMSAVTHNPLIRAVYQRAQQRGKCRMSALGICMHKIARIIYGMLKNNHPFDPGVDLAHQAKHRTHDHQMERTAQYQRLRRFQPHDIAAPITRREKKKREALHASQSAVCTQSEIIVNASQQPKYVPVSCT